MGSAVDERRRRKAPIEPPRAEPARDGRLTSAGVLRMQREHGNQAVQRMIRAAPARPVLARAKCVIQAAYMSGDMFGICAALTLDPTLRVVILEEEDDKFKGVREEQSALYESFYTTALKQSGVRDEDLPKRIKRVKVKDTQAVYKELTGDDGPGGKWATLRIAPGDEPRSAGFATTVVGNKYQGDSGGSQTAVRNAFTGRPRARATRSSPSSSPTRGSRAARSTRCCGSGSARRRSPAARMPSSTRASRACASSRNCSSTPAAGPCSWATGPARTSRPTRST